jgi:hypothetical protein
MAESSNSGNGNNGGGSSITDQVTSFLMEPLGIGLVVGAVIIGYLAWVVF